MPRISILCSKMSCGTLSKAFLKSRYRKTFSQNEKVLLHYHQIFCRDDFGKTTSALPPNFVFENHAVHCVVSFFTMSHSSLNITFPNTFDLLQRRLRDLYLFTSALSSSLKTGITSLIFQNDGKQPFDSAALNTIKKAFERVGIFLSTRLPMLSEPRALLVLIGFLKFLFHLCSHGYISFSRRFDSDQLDFLGKHSQKSR